MNFGSVKRLRKITIRLLTTAILIHHWWKHKFIY
jgi:hypothetical protein